MTEPFKISVRRWREQTVYSMWVEITYTSDQVIRCSVTGGTKYMHLEKDLTKKTNQWKIKQYNFKFGDNDQANALAFKNITEAIDDHLKGKGPDRLKKSNTY